MTRNITLALMSTILLSTQTQAVSFGHGTFLDPIPFLTKVESDPQHPSRSYLNAIQTAIDSTVMIKGLATGVNIAARGLIATSFHVISDMYVGPTNECRKIRVILFHQLDAQGKLDPRRQEVICKRLLVANFNNDFALFELELPEGTELPFVPFAIDDSQMHLGMRGLIIGHPHASDISRGIKKITEGPVVLYEPQHPELPHFLHLIDTEGGSSGGPMFTVEGLLVGIHFRGIPNHGQAVPVVIDGKPQSIRRFNVGLPFADLYRKFVTPHLDRP